MSYEKYKKVIKCITHNGSKRGMRNEEIENKNN